MVKTEKGRGKAIETDKEPKKSLTYSQTSKPKCLVQKKMAPSVFFVSKISFLSIPCERSAPRACWIFQQIGLWKLGQFQLLSQHRLQTIGPWQLLGMPRMIQGGTNLRSRRKHHFHKTRTNNNQFADVQEMSFQNSKIPWKRNVMEYTHLFSKCACSPRAP